MKASDNSSTPSGPNDDPLPALVNSILPAYREYERLQHIANKASGALTEAGFSVIAIYSLPAEFAQGGFVFPEDGTGNPEKEIGEWFDDYIARTNRRQPSAVPRLRAQKEYHRREARKDYEAWLAAANEVGFVEAQDASEAACEKVNAAIERFTELRPASLEGVLAKLRIARAYEWDHDELVPEDQSLSVRSMSEAIDFLASLLGEEIAEPLSLPPKDHTRKLCREWWERHERVLEIERQGKGLPYGPESNAQEARLEEAVQARMPYCARSSPTRQRRIMGR